ncbi:hypothetical protein LXL04_026746 [Taraxacum kok-saghyz]
MPEGTLEVLVVSAKGLENTDVLCNMDPYVIITYRSQEKKSNVASGKGSNPEWNETFLFDVSSKETADLKIKIMDSDTGSADDLVGHARQDDAYCGEIRIGLNFTAQKSRGFDPADANMGGWKQSSHD